MVTKVISKYLADNRRLVIPQLGTFLVKEPGHRIFFSELLKADDSVLLNLLKQEGLAELEAVGYISRYVFEIRFALRSNMDFVVGSLGVLKMDTRGVISFEQYQQGEESNEEDIEAQRCREAIVEPVEVQSIAVSEAAETEEEKDVEGMNLYHAAYPKGRRRAKPRRRFDAFMLIAIVVGVVAVGAILYGYFSDKAREQAEAESMMMIMDELSPSHQQDSLQ